MGNMKFNKSAILLTVIILNTGCTNESNQSLTGNLPSASPESTPITISTVTVPVTLPLEQVKAELKKPLTREQVHERFGYPQSTADSYIQVNGQLSSVEQEEYTEGSSRFYVQWSPEGEILYAVYYETDAWGNRHSFVPAMGKMQASSSQDNSLAREHAISIDKPAILYRSMNAYELVGGNYSITTKSVDLQTKYKVVTLSADFAEIQDESGYGGWVPTWYLTKESAKSRNISPVTLKVTSDAQALWYPNSNNSVAVQLKTGDSLYAYEAYDDWYGVVVPDNAASERPYGLLWVHKNQVVIDGDAPIWFDNRETGSDLSRSISSTVRSLVVPGITQSRVLELFGQPSFKESSENVKTYGEKVQTLPLWLYEDGHSELTVAWSETGILRYALYRDSSDSIARFGLQEQSRTLGPLVPSEQVQWNWRFKSDLAFNFLLDHFSNILLVAGEDGGFSGMHMNSNVYALDSITGRKIWQFDLGFDAHLYGLSANKSRMAFMKRMPGDYKPYYQLQVLSTDNGKMIWKKQLDSEEDVSSLAVSGNVVAAVRSEGMSSNEAENNYNLTAWSIATGKQMWRIELEEPAKLVRDVGNQKVLLLQIGVDMNPVLLTELQAYDPLTGKLVWEKTERQAAVEREVVDTNQFARQAHAYWTRTVDELVLTDAATGKDKVHLPLDDQTRYEIIDGQYAFQQQSSIQGLRDEVITSSLIDVRTGKKLFTEEGRAEFGHIDGKILYYRLNGRALSFDLLKGEQRWNSSDVPGEGTLPGSTIAYGGKRFGVFPFLSSIYTLDESTGKALNRISDVRVGYYDFTPYPLLNGYLSVIDNKLYVGSSNGYFSKLK
ncbi:MAG: PQQ-binding-like beta-propeller repeat protein [Candidatus Pristimantibacillus sp.]